MAASALRSALFVIWMGVTVVPWALAVVVASIFVRGNPIYWMCIAWDMTVCKNANKIKTLVKKYSSKCSLERIIVCYVVKRCRKGVSGHSR